MKLRSSILVAIAAATATLLIKNYCDNHAASKEACVINPVHYSQVALDMRDVVGTRDNLPMVPSNKQIALDEIRRVTIDIETGLPITDGFVGPYELSKLIKGVAVEDFIDKLRGRGDNRKKIGSSRNRDRIGLTIDGKRTGLNRGAGELVSTDTVVDQSFKSLGMGLDKNLDISYL